MTRYCFFTRWHITIVLSPIQSKQKLIYPTNPRSRLLLPHLRDRSDGVAAFVSLWEKTTAMKDIAIHLHNKPGALADMGETLGAAGVSLEGGGVFTENGKGIAHFLVEDAAGAKQALEAKGIEVA